MTGTTFIIGLLGVSAALFVPGCAESPPQALPSRSEPARGADELARAFMALRKPGGRLFALDPSASDVRILVFRAGRAAAAGHNHVLSAPRFRGYAWVPREGPPGARFALEFRLGELTIDDPAQRKKLGEAFSSVPSAAAIAATRDNMLGPDSMQADRHPIVRVDSLQISGDAPKFAARIGVEMHGVKREMWVPLHVEGLPDRLSVAGSLVLRQSDFGVTPYAFLGGLLAVQDEVVVEFDLIGREATSG